MTVTVNDILRKNGINPDDIEYQIDESNWNFPNGQGVEYHPLIWKKNGWVAGYVSESGDVELGGSYKGTADNFKF